MKKISLLIIHCFFTTNIWAVACKDLETEKIRIIKKYTDPLKIKVITTDYSSLYEYNYEYAGGIHPDRIRRKLAAFPDEEITSLTATLKSNQKFAWDYPAGVLEFKMNFDHDSWTFKRSYRSNVKEEYYQVYASDLNDVYATDFTHYMFNEVYRRYPNLITDTPKYLIREGLRNEKTISVLEDAINNSIQDKQLLKIFLNETPNGSHTRRVAERFGLTPSSILVDHKYWNIEVRME